MSLSPAWVILTKRFGGDIRSPTEDQLAQAVDELFNENIEGFMEGDYAEHAHAFLRYVKWTPFFGPRSKLVFNTKIPRRREPGRMCFKEFLDGTEEDLPSGFQS